MIYHWLGAGYAQFTGNPEVVSLTESGAVVVSVLETVTVVTESDLTAVVEVVDAASTVSAVDEGEVVNG